MMFNLPKNHNDAFEFVNYIIVVMYTILLASLSSVVLNVQSNSLICLHFKRVCKTFNPLEGRGVNWLHFAIQV